MKKNKVKFAIIGAGSVSFSPATVADILLNESFASVDIEIALMDIEEKPLRLSENYCRKCAEILKKKPVITASLDLRKSLEGADFVITCFEKDRYYYW
jgi:alpha-galactosidase